MIKNKKVILGTLILLLLFSISSNAALIEGNPAGEITLVEFLDYSCPHCQAMDKVIQQLIKTNPQLRMIYRPIPVYGQVSWLAAKCVIAVQENNLLFHHALLNSHQPLTKELIFEIMNKNHQDSLYVRDDQSIKELEGNLKLARELGITHLPTMIIGRSEAIKPSHVFYGETSIIQLQKMISELEN